MKYLALISLLALSVNSYASDTCYGEVEKHAYKAHGISGGTTILMGIEATDAFIAPGEDRGYLQGEIWHSKDADFNAQVYEVKLSVYGTGFIFAYLVNPETCQTSAMFEVWMED